MRKLTLPTLTLSYLLMKVDGNIDEREKEMIRKVMQKDNLSADYVNRIFDILSHSKDENSYKIATSDLLRLDNEFKQETIDTLMKVAKADNYVDFTEKNFIEKVKKDLLL